MTLVYEHTVEQLAEREQALREEIAEIEQSVRRTQSASRLVQLRRQLDEFRQKLDQSRELSGSRQREVEAQYVELFAERRRACKALEDANSAVVPALVAFWKAVDALRQANSRRRVAEAELRDVVSQIRLTSDTTGVAPPEPLRNLRSPEPSVSNLVDSWLGGRVSTSLPRLESER